MARFDKHIDIAAVDQNQENLDEASTLDWSSVCKTLLVNLGEGLIL